MSPSAVQSRPPRISRAAWMGELALGRSLRELCLPGTHDSGAYRLSDRIAPTAAQQPGLMRLASVLAGGDRYPARYRSLVRHMSVTQRRPVAEQLRDGIRLLDLRICACDGELWIHHGLLGPRLSEVLDDLASFVDGTDHELVVVRASHFTMGQGRDHHDVVSELLERFAGRLVPRGAEALTAPLGDLTADGSRLLWFYEPDDGNRVARDDAASGRAFSRSTASAGVATPRRRPKRATARAGRWPRADSAWCRPWPTAGRRMNCGCSGVMPGCP